MQLKFIYQGEELSCDDGKCNLPYCSRDLLMKVCKALIRPQLVPIINRIFEVQELLRLADVVSLGENQLHHILRMAEFAEMIKEEILLELGITKSDLITAVIFHDIGKGMEIDDSNYDPGSLTKGKPPKNVKRFVPTWLEYKKPLHLHIAKGIQLAEGYNLPRHIIEAIALHHHVKIYPSVLKNVAADLALAPIICDDILHFRPEQYSAKGSNLTQVIAILDQLCAIERKFQGRFYLSSEPDKLEDEVVRELVIGLVGPGDPRLKLLDANIDGRETVVLLDLRGFGAYVQLHSEYQVQAVKKEILNTIRSVVRVQDHYRDKDAVGLVGGDEYVVITKVQDKQIVKQIINRITSTVEARTGFKFRVGYGIGGTIPANFHEARTMANLAKKPRFVK